MVDADTIGLVVLGFFGGLGLVVYSYITFKHYQLIRDTPTSKIQSVSVGLAEVAGKVLPYAGPERELVYTHPIEGDDVVYYDLKIEEYQYDDDGSNWHTIETEERGERFIVDDGTGQIEVRIQDPRFEFADADSVQREFDLDEAEVPSVLEEHYDGDGLLSGLLESDRYRVTVKAIYPSEDVFVFGAASIRDTVESSTNEENIVIKNPGDDGSRGTFDFGTPQIISTLSEDTLQGTMKWHIPVSFGGGLLLSAGCLALLLFWFL